MSADYLTKHPEPLPASYARGPHWTALFAAAFTLPLLYVGGSVTTYRVGLAVPDWPQTFGINMFLYDFWNAPFGVKIEHTHRLYGAAVGLATVLLAGWFLVCEPRRWIRVLGVLSLLTVIIQGVLGGTRVTQVSTVLAAVHGVVGQAFFALMVVLCVVTGKGWHDRKAPALDTDHFRMRALILFGLVTTQLAVGSWLRHFGLRSALVIHATLAFVVWGHAVRTFVIVRKNKAIRGALFPSSLAVVAAASLQIVLGIVAMIFLLPFDGFPRPVTFYQAVVRTGHQTNGALLLAASVVLALRTLRRFYLSTLERVPGSDGVVRSASADPSALEWEAVA